MATLVIVPTYNEVDSLGEVLTRTLAAEPGLEILVVDDASPDGTGALADRFAAEQPRVHVLHRPAKAGLGSAYRDGFAWALSRDYDVIGEMDADASHAPEDLPRLLAGLAGADLVIGSRYVPGGQVRNWPWHRRALSRLANRYVRVMTGLPVADATAGFRLFRRDVVERIAPTTLRSDGYAFQVETTLRAWRSGHRVVEVPITFTERRSGASKLSRTIVLEAMWRVARWGISGRRAGRKPGAVRPG